MVYILKKQFLKQSIQFALHSLKHKVLWATVLNEFTFTFVQATLRKLSVQSFVPWQMQRSNGVLHYLISLSITIRPLLSEISQFSNTDKLIGV